LEEKKERERGRGEKEKMGEGGPPLKHLPLHYWKAGELK